MINKIKAYLQRRKELKPLEKQMDKKIASGGINYMFSEAYDWRKK